MPDDIRHFSSPNNYWCFTFEHAVHGYIERSSNQKNLELIFAKAESRKELLKYLFDLAGGCSSASEPVITVMDTGKINCLFTMLIPLRDIGINITEPILVDGKKSILLQSQFGG